MTRKIPTVITCVLLIEAKFPTSLEKQRLFNPCIAIPEETLKLMNVDDIVNAVDLRRENIVNNNNSNNNINDISNGLIDLYVQEGCSLDNTDAILAAFKKDSCNNNNFNDDLDSCCSSDSD